MRLTRILIIVLLLLGGFWFVTTHFPLGFFAGHPTLIGSDGSNSPLELTEAHAAPAYDAEEQNNIAIYKESPALGGQHYLHHPGLRLLLWNGAAAGPGFGLHPR
jgi:hypothetical protein